MSARAFSDKARAYFRERAIYPAAVERAGVREESGAIVFPCVAADGSSFDRRRSLNGGPAKVLQPAGQSLTPWWPAGRPDAEEIVLCCEGESDALAALSALPHGPDVAGLAALPVVAIPGTGFSAAKLVEELSAIGARQALLAFDADDAGRKATAKLVEALVEAGIQPAPVDLEDGHDLAATLARLATPGERGDWLASLLVDAGCAAAPLEEAAPSAPVEAPETAEVLDEVAGLIAKFVVLPSEHEAVAVALWVAHTWAFDGAHATPYMLVVSPEKRSGKSRLLEVLGLLVRKPWYIAAASEAAMFRKINETRPTLLLDEIDAIFGSSTERTEPLRAILNAGNRPGAAVARCVGEGAKQTVVDFSVYCPKVLAGIDTGRVPDTIVDRSIRFAMKRKTETEMVAPFRHRYADVEARPVREGLEAWGATHAERLYAVEPDLPAGLDDRAAEAWEPLFAIADLAGGDWPAQARAAAVALIGDDSDEPGHGARLLAKLRRIFAGHEVLATTRILEIVNADEELPFGGWRHGDGLDARGLSRLLKPYGIRPRSVRADGGSKGYRRDQLEEAWARYLPSTPASPAQAAQAAQPASSPEPDVPDVPDVPDKSGGKAEARERPATEAEEAEIERLAAKFGGVAQ